MCVIKSNFSHFSLKNFYFKHRVHIRTFNSIDLIVKLIILTIAVWFFFYQLLYGYVGVDIQLTANTEFVSEHRTREYGVAFVYGTGRRLIFIWKLIKLNTTNNTMFRCLYGVDMVCTYKEPWCCVKLVTTTIPRMDHIRIWEAQ